MRVYPHILLKKGDIIVIPGGVVNHVVQVVNLIDGHLLCTAWNNVFTLSWGFFYKDDFGNYRPFTY